MSLLRVGQRVTAVLSGWLIVVIVATSAHAQMDVVVLNTGIIAKNGTVGEVTAYSLASTSCNVGSQVAVWVDDTNEHPVIAGNLYRIDNGLLEQIGMSWLKHAFCAVNEPGCGDCQGTPCDTLGVQCADTYGAGLNGAQQGLGPRSDVNATTGEFQYPFPTQGQTGDPIYKRCQVRTTDLDPALHPDAEYFGVVQYVTTDEQAFGTQFNNVSYRRATVGAFDGSGFPLTYIGDTVTQADPIDAWDAIAGDVERVEILTTEANLEGIPGRWVIGTRVENPAPNLYRYQYAIYNDNSDRSLQGLTLPLPPGITLQSIHFHDVDYHSGEPYDNSDWQVEVGADFIRWSGETFANNANANALRWGTTYSFSFETNAPPTAAMATLDYFKPGSIPSESFTTRVPSANFTLGVTQLDCSATGGAVQLDWSNADSYDSLQISRDGTPLALLPGNSTSFTDPSPEVGLHTYSVTADIGGLLSAAVSCQLEVPIPIAFTFPNGLPTFWNDTGGEIAVNIAAALGTTLDTSSAVLLYDLGAGEIELPLTFEGNDDFTATWSELSCGASVNFRWRASTTNGVVVLDPAVDLPPYTALVGIGLDPLVEDDLEGVSGWTSGSPDDTATTGLWERVDPNGTVAQPEDDQSSSGTLCWVTGQGSAGGAAGENDVDNGRVTLLSPIYDLAGTRNPFVAYWRWFSNDSGAAPGEDVLRVQITNDGLQWIDVEMVGPTGTENSGGWFFHSFRVREFLEPNTTVQLRFIAEDSGGASIVEAAIDDFSISDVACAGTTGPDIRRDDCNGDENYSIVDPLTLLEGLFLGGSLPCFDGCDADDDGSLDLGDALWYLNNLFGAGPSPLPPTEVCAPDPTSADGLGCAQPLCP